MGIHRRVVFSNTIRPVKQKVRSWADYEVDAPVRTKNIVAVGDDVMEIFSQRFISLFQISFCFTTRNHTALERPTDIRQHRIVTDWSFLQISQHHQMWSYSKPAAMIDMNDAFQLIYHCELEWRLRLVVRHWPCRREEGEHASKKLTCSDGLLTVILHSHWSSLSLCLTQRLTKSRHVVVRQRHEDYSEWVRRQMKVREEFDQQIRVKL